MEYQLIQGLLSEKTVDSYFEEERQNLQKLSKVYGLFLNEISNDKQLVIGIQTSLIRS